MSIRAILFDFDGTLRIPRPRGREVFIQHVQQLGHTITEHQRQVAARWEHYYWAYSLEIQQDFKKYGDETDAFYDNYSRRQLIALGLGMETAQALAPELHRRMSERERQPDWIPDELPGVLTSLRETGYRLGVVSNRSNPYHEMVAATGLHPHFELVLAAGEVNSYKPDSKIFHHAVEKMQAAPHETMYVGDNYFADVVGARNAGLLPVLYDPEGLFDDPGCPVITHFSQLKQVLGG